MDIDFTTGRLREGIKKIISEFSPPCNTGLSSRYRRTIHDNREFLFAIDGSCSYMCNYSVYSCDPGTLILFNSGVPHGHEYILCDHELLHVWGHITKYEFYVDLLEVQGNGQRRDIPNLHHLRIDDELKNLLVKRWDMLDQCAGKNDEKVWEYLHMPLNMVLDEIAFNIRRRNTNAHSKTFSDSVKEYILSVNGRECSLKQLAAFFDCTPCYLSGKFHAESGMTVKEFITTTRLKYVRSALKKNIKQKEIAYVLGFASPASFWNWMNKHRHLLQ